MVPGDGAEQCPGPGESTPAHPEAPESRGLGAGLRPGAQARGGLPSPPHLHVSPRAQPSRG